MFMNDKNILSTLVFVAVICALGFALSGCGVRYEFYPYWPDDFTRKDRQHATATATPRFDERRAGK